MVKCTSENWMTSWTIRGVLRRISDPILHSCWINEVHYFKFIYKNVQTLFAVICILMHSYSKNMSRLWGSPKTTFLKFLRTNKNLEDKALGRLTNTTWRINQFPKSISEFFLTKVQFSKTGDNSFPASEVTDLIHAIITLKDRGLLKIRLFFVKHLSQRSRKTCSTRQRCKPGNYQIRSPVTRRTV